MLVALTGANGFLGTRVASALQQRGHRVRALIHVHEEAVRHQPCVDQCLTGNQNDADATAKLVAGAGAVIHVAIDWAALNAGPLPNAEQNLLSALRLLEQARLVEVPQFIYVSSLDVYHEVLPDRPLDETHPAWPGSIYGSLKAAVELHLKAYHAAYGMNTSAWRPAAMCGIKPAAERSHWFDLVRQIKRGETIDSHREEDVVWVQDVAEALALAVGDDSVGGEIYNLADVHVDAQLVTSIARELLGSAASSQTPSALPRQRFDCAKAIDFFNRHGNRVALRRGAAGIRHYLAELLRKA